jgi:Asp-tRNA(Asn)/Glu-tRNA(Gln) amidotransferase A subunit family amidase
MRDERSGVDRRGFLAAGLAGGAAAGMAPWFAPATALAQQAQDEAPTPPGIGPETIAEAQKTLGLEFTAEEREAIAQSIGDLIGFYGVVRAAGLRNEEGPAEIFDPRLPGFEPPAGMALAGRYMQSRPGTLPETDADICFAPVSHLAHWVRTRQITSERLTRLYLDRLRRLNAQLECVVTFMDEPALAQARRADAEIAAGNYRGPLHGLPWGAKDLFDTAGVPTTWGAAPWKDRVPDRDATVVRKLDEAGAVLIAKLSMGALAYGDIWFGGRTRNPFNLEQGSSGSSAGSASATAAGCCAFTLGTETYGSIGSPSARCGATGFRPTFGRVSRDGAMALCWSLDKVGPICRTAECCAHVLEAINGYDPGDPATTRVPLPIDMITPLRGMKIGYDPSSYEGRWVTDEDRAVLDILRDERCELVEVSIPDGPWGQMIFMLITVEAAAAFDEMTRTNQDDLLTWQSPQAWPNTFRTGRFIPAVDYYNATRWRRRLMRETNELFGGVQAIVAPQAHGAMHAITNMTGHPAITMRTGFRDDGTPRANTVWGRLYDDAAVLRIGATLEGRLDQWSRRPALD